LFNNLIGAELFPIAYYKIAGVSFQLQNKLILLLFVEIEQPQPRSRSAAAAIAATTNATTTTAHTTCLCSSPNLLIFNFKPFPPISCSNLFQFFQFSISNPSPQFRALIHYLIRFQFRALIRLEFFNFQFRTLSSIFES